MIRWIKSIPLVFGSVDDASKPDIEIDDVLQITPELINKHNIEYIIFDVDQTLVPQSQLVPNDRVINHLKALAGSLKGTICFLTNEPNDQRSQILKKRTGFSVVSGNWRKPEPDAFANALSHLGVTASKRIAMVGDRRWTDILGANKAGLFSILVNPISPSLDKFGTGLARSAEIYSAKTGKLEYVAFLGSIASITGINLLAIALYFAENFSASWSLGFFTQHRLWWAGALVIFSVFYFRFVALARSRVAIPNDNPITAYFNTYPLALRFICSVAIIILIFMNWFSSARLVEVGLIFCLFSSLTLAASLFPFYHNQEMRAIRVGIDILLVFVMASGLDGYYKFMALAYLSVPIATASRHMGLFFNSAIVAASIGILFYILSTFQRELTDPQLISEQAYYMIVFVFIGIYVMTALIIRLEYRELTTPFNQISHYFEHISQTGRLNNYLRGAAKSINCSGIIILKLFEGGVFYFADNHLQYGRVTASIAEEIGNFLASKKDKLDSLDLSRQSDINVHSNIVKELERLIKPPISNGVTAAIALKVPQVEDVYFIAMNPLSRNGTIRSNFWIHHVAVMRVLALGVGVSLNGFMRDADFRATELTAAQTEQG